MNHWSCEFIPHLIRADGNVRVAAELSGVSVRMAYKLRSQDRKFAVAWADALRKIHQLRSTARHRRAALLEAMLAGELVHGCVNEGRYTLRMWTARDAGKERAG